MPEYLIQTVDCGGSSFEQCKDEQELKEKIQKIKKYFPPYNKILGIYQKVNKGELY